MTKNISPIEAANALTPHWMRTIKDFDALEIHPCAIIGRDSNGIEYVEVYEPEQEDFWTVYGHFRARGVNAFEDFPTEPEATAFRDRLIAAYPHLAA
jgi:hypothetical protein